MHIISQLKFCCRFKEKDAFVGYHKDVAAAVVFQASSQLKKTCQRLKKSCPGRHHVWESAWNNRLLGECSLEELAKQDEGSDIYRKAVCCNLLLHMSILLHWTDANMIGSTDICCIALWPPLFITSVKTVQLNEWRCRDTHVKNYGGMTQT